MPRAEDACRDLLAKALHLKALCASAEPGVVPFGVARAKRDLFAAADAAQAALAAPVTVKPWEGWRPDGGRGV